MANSIFRRSPGSIFNEEQGWDALGIEGQFFAPGQGATAVAFIMSGFWEAAGTATGTITILNRRMMLGIGT